jgi:hypothetical protein
MYNFHVIYIVYFLLVKMMIKNLEKCVYLLNMERWSKIWFSDQLVDQLT